MDFLDKFSVPRQVKDRKLVEKFNSTNARKLVDGVRLREATLGPQTMKILSSLKTCITPKKKHQLRIRTHMELNMISVLISLLQNREADEVIIATYTLNKEAFDILLNLVEAGVIKKLRFMLASSLRFRDPKHVEYMTSKVLEHPGKIHLVFAYSHFKITLVAVQDYRYQIEGSMNYSRNNSAENLLIEENEVQYEFDRSFLLELMIKKGRAVEVVS